MTDLPTDQKRKLLARLLQERGAQQTAKRVEGDRAGRSTSAGAAAALPLRPIDRSGELELSFGQERVWFVEQLQPESLFYNVVERFGLGGQLDVELLRRSIEAIVRRHEVLRTIYPTVGGRPMQKIQPPGPWRMPFIDLRSYPATSREKEAQRLIVAEGKTLFDLAVGPLLRTTLLQLADEEYVLAVTVHHIAIDGWSLRLLMHELAEHYSALVEGRAPLLPELQVQYADFACWQRRWFSGEVLAKQRSYWLDHLGKNPPTLDLPTDYVCPAVRTFDGATHYSVIPPALLSKLRALSRHEGVTLFTVLLASFSTLLMRYSTQENFVLGTLAAGRLRPEVEKMLGFFANTLALRIDFSGNPTFRQALERAREVVAGAHANEAFPFEKLVEEIKPERGRSSNPLTQVFINMLNFWKRDELVLPGLRVRPLGGLDLHAVADAITLFVSESHEHVDLCYVYSTELFKLDTIERMAAHFLTLLWGIVANPDERVWALPILPDAERKSIEQMAAGTNRAAPVDVPLHQLFEAQVQARANAIAVSCGEEHLSYAELDRRANNVARRLKAMGVAPDTIVGLCAERSLDLMIGVLGILKSGGAYVPLDPGDPKDRLSFILADTRATVVVSHRAAQAALPEMSGTKVLLLDDVSVEVDHSAMDLGSGNVGPHNLAYVIYTSGSTGRPKGVLITHGNVVRLLRSTESWFAFGSDDVWTLFHSFAFDFSVWELWGALAYGGRLIVVPFAVSRDPRAFLSLLARERVTVLNQTPSAFRVLMEADRIADPQVSTSLRVIIFGGEALELQGLRGWVERHGDAHPRLINMYGITETCVHVTYRPITRDDIESKRGSVIGVPLPDLRVSLRDAYGQFVPFGVPGEIYVGGPGLAKGYLNRPELTAERFVSDSSRPSERLYRSGDLARRSPDGELEYLGRIDQQVKIRGFRVEVGEIESALTEHPTVSEAVVVVRTMSGENALIAYVVPASSSAVVSDDLRTHLRKKLPSYMLPQTIEVLSSLPLNRNGKVDRHALPAPAKSAIKAANFRTPTEQRVAAIWEEVLEADSVGPDDDFFDLGGHSLMIVRVLYQINASLGVSLGVPDLFQNPTVEQLADVIDRQQYNRRRQPEVVLLQEGSSGIPLYFIYAGPDEFRLARSMGTSRPVYGVQVPWPLKWRRAVEANRVSSYPNMDQFAAPFVNALFAHVGSAPCMLAGHSFAGLVAFETARQLKIKGGNIESVLIFDKWAKNPALFQVAWKNLWQCWMKRTDSTQGFAKSILNRFRRSAIIILWPLRIIASVVIGSLWPKQGQLTTTFDEEGVPLPWGLLVRLYSEIEKKYCPPPALDCRGIIFRTDFMDLNQSVRVLDESLGWQKLFTRGLTCISLSGDHISIFREQSQLLALTINTVLQQRDND